MNRIRRSVRLFALAVLAAGLANAQPPELRYKFAEGETLRYRVTQAAELTADAGEAGRIELRTEQVTELAWRVAAVDGDGVATIEQTVPRLKFTSASELGEVGFDSASEDPPQSTAAMLAPALRTLLEETVAFTVSPRGGIGEPVASDTLIGALERVPGAGEIVDGKRVLRGLVAAVLPPLPGAADEVAWSRETPIPLPQAADGRLTTEYRRGPPDGAGVAVLLTTPRLACDSATLDSELCGESACGGETRFDPSRGRVLAGESRLGVRFEQGGVTGRLKQTVRVEALGDDSPSPPAAP